MAQMFLEDLIAAGAIHPDQVPEFKANPTTDQAAQPNSFSWQSAIQSGLERSLNYLGNGGAARIADTFGSTPAAASVPAGMGFGTSPGFVQEMEGQRRQGVAMAAALEEKRKERLMQQRIAEAQLVEQQAGRNQAAQLAVMGEAGATQRAQMGETGATTRTGMTLTSEEDRAAAENNLRVQLQQMGIDADSAKQLASFAHEIGMQASQQQFIKGERQATQAWQEGQAARSFKYQQQATAQQNTFDLMKQTLGQWFTGKENEKDRELRARALDLEESKNKSELELMQNQIADKAKKEEFQFYSSNGALDKGTIRLRRAAADQGDQLGMMDASLHYMENPNNIGLTPDGWLATHEDTILGSDGKKIRVYIVGPHQVAVPISEHKDRLFSFSEYEAYYQRAYNEIVGSLYRRSPSLAQAPISVQTAVAGIAWNMGQNRPEVGQILKAVERGDYIAAQKIYESSISEHKNQKGAFGEAGGANAYITNAFAQQDQMYTPLINTKDEMGQTRTAMMNPAATPSVDYEASADGTLRRADGSIVQSGIRPSVPGAQTPTAQTPKPEDPVERAKWYKKQEEEVQQNKIAQEQAIQSKKDKLAEDTRKTALAYWEAKNSGDETLAMYLRREFTNLIGGENFSNLNRVNEHLDAYKSEWETYGEKGKPKGVK